MIDFNKFVDRFTRSHIIVDYVYWATIKPKSYNLGYKTSAYAFVFLV